MNYTFIVYFYLKKACFLPQIKTKDGKSHPLSMLKSVSEPVKEDSRVA